jgi:squalene synthase HpnC
MPEAQIHNAGLLSSTEHYENFPVASALVPARLRPAIAAVYRFARYADDVADEGVATSDQRLAELTQMSEAIEHRASHPMVEPLYEHIQAHQIESRHFVDLLSAFSQDAAGAQYRNRTELLDYCRRSASPVGRIVLRIFDADAKPTLAPSDAICDALQLINFAQDAGQDIERGRNYFPADEMNEHGVTSNDLEQCVRQRQASAPVRALLDAQCDRAHELMQKGPALLKHVPLRLRLELSAVIAGGITMLERVKNEDPFAKRLKLGRTDFLKISRHAGSIYFRRSVQ